MLLVLAAAFVSALAAAASEPAYAGATLPVDCTADPGALATALALATDGDTLSIQGTCKGTFEIAHSLTLSGSAGATLDAQGAGTVVTIDVGKTVNVTGLTIRGGSTFLTKGAGISTSGTLSLTDSTVTGNSTYEADGAGIYNVGTLTLTNTTVSGNSTTLYANGGGIYTSGSLSLTNSTVTGNSAGHGSYGGGIYSNGATLTLTDSTVSANSGNSGAGGIFQTGGSLNLSGGAVTENTSSFGPGGGVFNQGGVLTLTGATVDDNTAGGTGGAGIFNVGGGQLTLNGSTISGNNGGGIQNESGGSVTLDGSTVSDNVNGSGGILNYGGTATVNESNVSGNGSRGIWNAAGTMTIADSTVSDNTGFAFGGGISNQATLTVTGTTVSGNTAYGGGGIDNFFDGTLTVRNSTFSGNSATSSGGAIENDSYLGPSSLVVENTTISGNSAPFAGGLYGNPMTLRSTIVAGQTSGGNCAASVTDGGYNLEDSTSCGFSTANHSLPNTDPRLDPAGLQDNGGRTRTIALLPQSPAINLIPPTVNGCGTTLTSDQRGVSRPQGPGCDIGAFELFGPTRIRVVNSLVPSYDPGRFNLQIDGTTYKTNAGNGGTTGYLAVAAGDHTVSETAGTNTSLTNYVTRIACSNGSTGNGSSLSGVHVAAGQDVTCVITNTRRLYKP